MDIGFKVKSKNPKENISFISKLFFGWMMKIVRKGTKVGLEFSDLFQPLDKDKSELLGNKLEWHWQNELYKSNETMYRPSFLKAIWKTFYLEFMMFGILWFILSVILRSSLPVILARLISLYAEPFSDDKNLEFYLTSTVIVGVVTLTVFFLQHIQFGLSCIGMRIRIASSSLVYRKISKLSHRSLRETAAGQIINMLSNDVSRFDLALVALHALWAMPFQIIVLTYFLWQQVGVASLAGIFSMAFISLPVQSYMGKLMGNYRSSISKSTDYRVKLMNEIISGIQVIKMYAWEKPFENIIKVARAREIKDITSTSYLRGVFSSCSVFLDRSALFITIIVFVLQGNHIKADVVFSLAQTFNILQLTMAVWFPLAISLGAEALISIIRLQEFLIMEERFESNIEYIKQNGIILSNVTACWSDFGKTLENIVLEVPPGTLCAVVGPVGSGKSSLLQLLLGELPTESGRVQIGKEISYSSQDPWLFQSTVRNNILFGQPYNSSWYNKIVKVCALERDFEQLPKGDKTIVGEKGVSLSGGQRARINLARAVYRQADIYLLDDPLSAVDTHVCKHLFDQCIIKHLKGKTRILVTHQLQQIKEANLIVVISEGRIQAQGSYEDLLKSKLDFTKLLVHSVKYVEKQDEVIESESSIPTHSRTPLLSLVSSDVSLSADGFKGTDPHDEQSGSDPNSRPFRDYLLATNNMCLLVFIILLLIIAQAICAGIDLWVAFWTSQEKLRYSNNSFILKENITQVPPLQNTFSFDNLFDSVEVGGIVHKLVKTEYALYIYGILIGGAITLTICRSLLFFKICMMASINLHSKIFHSLLQAPMKFFNNNPSGRILNRFSKDLGAIDEILPRELLDSVQIFLVLCGILVNVGISNPYAIIAMFILGLLFFKMRSWYIGTAKNIKHLEGITKSPIFSHVNCTLNGITTIRATKTTDVLIGEFDQHQDVHTSAWYLLISCIYSFGLWLDIMCVLFIASICFTFVILHSYTPVSSSMVGLALAQSMILTGMLQYGMRQIAEVINQLTSVERVMEYTKIEVEGPFETPEGNKPRHPWPQDGLIDYDKIFLSYMDNEPPVLQDLSFSIMPGEKIGIVGRTGAGKSSVLAALFRLAPFDGTISIDGIDTKKIGLTDLRKSISIIPQVPVLFSATLRYNLDPFGEFNDEQIWNVLEQVELRDFDSLDYMVAEGGTNFSLGQRQLLCLARAVLRNNKILVLDEATANVDPRTDSFIQRKIREKFADCTVLTIAHRLNTIMDSDRIIVMHFGKVVEFDHPHKLVQIPDGYFHKLIMETGPTMSMVLKDIAMTSYAKQTEFTESA